MSPSLELSPLGLPSPPPELVAPIDPVESSPRFGFGEDLGLLDPEAGPGGFVVFAREPSRCELTYARNNPLKYVDPDGKATVLAEAVAGGIEAAGAFVSRGGAAVNNGTIVGIALDATLGTAGDLVGGMGDMFRVGDSIGSVMETGGDFHDVTMAVTTDFVRSTQLFVTAGAVATPASGVGPKLGSSGGPGAGARFSAATKVAARAESSNCVFCGVRTTSARGPLQSNIDHAIAKSKGGNNTLANAQNTCRTCNLQKGTTSSLRFALRSVFEKLFRKAE